MEFCFGEVHPVVVLCEKVIDDSQNAQHENDHKDQVAGIDKRLELIKPNLQGHEEMSIIGNEAIVAKEVNISINTVNERKKILLRREKYGRTGVFLKKEIQINESTEEILKKLAIRKSIVRKKLFKR